MRQNPRGFALGAILAAALIAPGALAQVTRTPPPQPSAPPPPPANGADQSNIDIAYGAYQRGLYITAFNEATKRAQQNDAAAMVLLGEMYAQGLGVGRDDLKAAQWYKIAADRGNRDALLVLGMSSCKGRTGPCERAEVERLLG